MNIIESHLTALALMQPLRKAVQLSLEKCDIHLTSEELEEALDFYITHVFMNPAFSQTLTKQDVFDELESSATWMWDALSSIKGEEFKDKSLDGFDGTLIDLLSDEVF